MANDYDLINVGKTLKVIKYRGSNVYIRFLFARWYEVLVVLRGRIYAHQIHVDKAGRQKKRLSHNEVEAGAIDTCLRAGIQLVDNLKKELSFTKVAANKIKTIFNTYGKARKWFGSHASLPQEQQE